MRSERSEKSHPPDGPADSPAGSAAREHEARRAAFIQAEVDRALTMWRGLLPDDVLEAFRERTEIHLLTDPQMIRAIDAAVPRPPADHSEIVPAAASRAAGSPADPDLPADPDTPAPTGADADKAGS